METGTRGELLDHLADAVAALPPGRPARVAFDGRPAAGKTTLADELGDVLRARGRYVIRAQIESFLNPRAVRYRRGEHSPVGNYEDSFDFAGLYRALLDPLGPGGDRAYRTAVYDRERDAPLDAPPVAAPEDAVLLFEGVFLLRPELADRWDLRVFVSVPFEETLRRARVRDLAEYGSLAGVDERFTTRYRPSQQWYLDTVRPLERADVIVHNERPAEPRWETRAR